VAAAPGTVLAGAARAEEVQVLANTPSSTKSRPVTRGAGGALSSKPGGMGHCQLEVVWTFC
jgi:hypothetical protein